MVPWVASAPEGQRPHVFRPNTFWNFSEKFTLDSSNSKEKNLRRRTRSAKKKKKMSEESGEEGRVTALIHPLLHYRKRLKRRKI